MRVTSSRNIAIVTISSGLLIFGFSSNCLVANAFQVRTDIGIYIKHSPFTNVISSNTRRHLIVCNPSVNPYKQYYTHISNPHRVSQRSNNSSITRRYAAQLMGDYSNAAHGLFGNMIGAASVLTSALIQFIFTSDKMPNDTSSQKRRQKLFLFVGLLSLGCNVISIMYATVACNKLVETPTVPSRSAYDLIKRDYELSWLGTNLGFLGGLCGFLFSIMLRVYSFYPSNIKTPTVGLVGGTMLLAISIMNRGVVHQGGSSNGVLGGFGRSSSSVLSLISRYLYLVGANIPHRGPLSLSATLIGTISLFQCAKSLLIDRGSTKKQIPSAEVNTE